MKIFGCVFNGITACLVQYDKTAKQSNNKTKLAFFCCIQIPEETQQDAPLFHKRTTGKSTSTKKNRVTPVNTLQSSVAEPRQLGKKA